MNWFENLMYKGVHCLEKYVDYATEKAPYKLRKPMVYMLMKPLHTLANRCCSKDEKTNFKEDWEEVSTQIDDIIEEQKISNSKLSKILE